MDASRVIELVFLTLSLVLLSHQIATDSNDSAANTGFICPLVDNTIFVNGKLIHSLVRTAECVNGRQMPGCCIQRLFCDYNTSNIELSLYGPPGFRMTCSDICCPQKYILPIPLPKISNSTKNYDDNDDDSSIDDSDNSVDSDSDENN